MAQLPTFDYPMFQYLILKHKYDHHHHPHHPHHHIVMIFLFYICNEKYDDICDEYLKDDGIVYHNDNDLVCNDNDDTAYI